LIAGQTDAAAETYRQITTHLNEDTRQVVVQDLEELSQNRPDLREDIAAIVMALQAATFPQGPD